MTKGIQIIKSENLIKNAHGAAQADITSAEKKLNVRFSSDFKEYLSEVGSCIFRSHEIVGIGKNRNTDVVSVTEDARDLNPSVPANLYVIEDTHFDGIIIWQDESGTVWQTYPNAQPKKIADSLLAYLGIE